MHQEPKDYLTAAIFARAGLNPTPESDSAVKAIHRSLLRHRISIIISDYRIPDHPSYSMMICRAIRELNEEKGSTEDAISKFIEKNYGNLPWHHKTLTGLHLGKLCDRCAIVKTMDRRYLIVTEERNNSSSSSNNNNRRAPKRQRLDEGEETLVIDGRNEEESELTIEEDIKFMETRV